MIGGETGEGWGEGSTPDRPTETPETRPMVPDHPMQQAVRTPDFLTISNSSNVQYWRGQ